MNKLLFLCISLGILAFNVIFTNLGPIIKGKVGGWSSYACKMYQDSYNYAKKEKYNDPKDKDENLKEIKKAKTRCDRRKAMNGLEYVVANLNFIFGFICAFAGFLLYQNIGNLGNDSKYIGLIGLGCGAVGFVLTLVYVIESGLIFTDIDSRNIEPYSYDKNVRIDSKGAFLKWDGGKNRYTCIFYKENKKDSLFLKFSDYGNKYLNYKKELNFNNNKDYFKYQGCISSVNPDDLYDLCDDLQKKTEQELTSDLSSGLYYIKNIHKYHESNDPNSQLLECDKKYFNYINGDNSKKVIYDHWVTSLIFSCLIMVLYLGLILFGFLLFREAGSSGASVPSK